MAPAAVHRCELWRKLTGRYHLNQPSRATFKKFSSKIEQFNGPKGEGETHLLKAVCLQPLRAPRDSRARTGGVGPHRGSSCLFWPAAWLERYGRQIVFQQDCRLSKNRVILQFSDERGNVDACGAPTLLGANRGWLWTRSCSNGKGWASAYSTEHLIFRERPALLRW